MAKEDLYNVVKEILRKQLELLAEESKSCSGCELATLTSAMVSLAANLLSL